MADSNEELYELNEVSWWSLWAESRWFGRDAYAFFSRDFDEYFFNRAGFLKVTSRSGSLLEELEAEFQSRGLTPHVFVRSDSVSPGLLQKFAKNGYRVSDQMSVMEMGDPSLSVNPELTLEMGNRERIDEWVDVFLRAFYGSAELASKVMPIIRRVSTGTDTSLLLASLEGKVVGGLALFRSPEVCGVYCVGTVPESRGKHVASTMLDFAAKLAMNEKRKLILQTIMSDSVEPLYLRLGFDRAYMKDLFVRDVRRVQRSQGVRPG